MEEMNAQGAYASLLEQIKRAVDPAGILAFSWAVGDEREPPNFSLSPR